MAIIFQIYCILIALLFIIGIGYILFQKIVEPIDKVLIFAVKMIVIVLAACGVALMVTIIV